MRRFLLLAAGVAALLFLPSSCSPSARLDERTRRLLKELDSYIETAQSYVANKEEHLAALRSRIADSADPVLQYECEMDLADAFFPYSFDSTQAHLKRCQQIALETLSDSDRYNRASIVLGHLYTKAGNYMEAHTVFYDQIDTSSLSEERKADYFLALYDFSRDISGNSGVVDFQIVPDKNACRERLYALLEPSSEAWRGVRMHELMEEWKLSAADSLCTILLEGTSPEEHNYAIYAFERSDIAYYENRHGDRLEWLVRSAESDIIGAVKDYASLTMIAQIILPMDVDRSFRYLRIAQEDALFYNAKLRPWQISRFLMEVESAYQERQNRMSRTVLYGLVLVGILAVILAAITWLLIVRSRKLTQLNQTLQELNLRVSQADRIKEEYIVGFLQGLADQISTVRTEDNRYRNLLKQGKSAELLKDLSASGRAEKARENFYQTFDRTFLAMHPDFVEQFNALLREEARIYPPEGKLSTELRIFALIRLGVDDSKRIAAMLDYSLSTIYNHKVRIKNAALGDRISFEERVKNIGK